MRVRMAHPGGTVHHLKVQEESELLVDHAGQSQSLHLHPVLHLRVPILVEIAILQLHNQEKGDIAGHLLLMIQVLKILLAQQGRFGTTLLELRSFNLIGFQSVQFSSLLLVPQRS